MLHIERFMGCDGRSSHLHVIRREDGMYIATVRDEVGGHAGPPMKTVALALRALDIYIAPPGSPPPVL